MIYIYTQLFPSIYVAYTPIAHANLNIANPHAIPKLSHTTFNLLPLTSCHPHRDLDHRNARPLRQHQHLHIKNPPL